MRKAPGVLGVCAITVAISVLAAGCISTQAPARTGLAATSANVTVDTSRVAMRIDETLGLWLGAVEWRADTIRSESTDPDIRRAALLWKLNASNAMLRATSHNDPLVSFMDAWALVFQFKTYFEDGPGADVFGEHTALARELSDLAIAEFNELAGRIANPQGVQNGRRTVADFAASQPIVNPNFLRRSVAADLIDSLPPDTRNAFAQLGAITQTVEGLSSRLAIYAAYIPKQARWQAELLLEDPSTSNMLGGVIEDVAGVNATATRVAETLDRAVDSKLDEVLSTALMQVAAELDRVETLINRQRELVLDQLPTEYERVFEKVTEQRLEALLQVESKIDEALDRVDALADRSLGNAEDLTRGTVDYAFERATPLLIGAFFGLLILILVYRLVPQRVRQN